MVLSVYLSESELISLEMREEVVESEQVFLAMARKECGLEANLAPCDTLQ